MTKKKKLKIPTIASVIFLLMGQASALSAVNTCQKQTVFREIADYTSVEWDWFTTSQSSVTISEDRNVAISLAPDDSQNAATLWQKHKIDMVGATKFSFNLTVDLKCCNFAFIWQREGLEAQGETDADTGTSLGGVAGIFADLAIVFDTTIDQVRVVSGLAQTGRASSASTLAHATVSGLGKASSLPVEITLRDSLLSVTVRSRQYLAFKVKDGDFEPSLKYFVGLTAIQNNDSSLQPKTVTLDSFNIVKTEPVSASVQIWSQSTEETLDSGTDALLTGQLRVTLFDACDLPSTILTYLPETLLRVGLKSPVGDSSDCTFTTLPHLFDSENYQPEDLQLQFNCQIKQDSASVQESTELELFLQGEAQEKQIVIKGDAFMSLSTVTSGDSTAKKLAHVVVEGADLMTGQLKQLAYLNNPYQIKVKAYDSDYKPVATYADKLSLIVTQAAIQRVASPSQNDGQVDYFFTHEVSMECYLSEVRTPCSDEFTVNEASDFIFVFVPTQVGTYSIKSPYLATPSFHINVIEQPIDDFGSAQLISTTFLSTSHSYAEIVSSSESLEMVAGETFSLQVHLLAADSVPISHKLSSQCTISESFYVINDGVKQTRGFFETIDYENLYLSALVVRAGTLTAHPVVTCGSNSEISVFKYEYPIKCAGVTSEKVCQKVIKPRTVSNLQVRILRDHSTTEILAEELAASSFAQSTASIDQTFLQGENLVFDLIAVDIFGNQVIETDFSGTSATFYSGSQKFLMSATVMSGVVHCSSESEEQNILFKELPPRSDFYKVVTSSSQKDLDGITIQVDIINLLDLDYPTNIGAQGESLKFSKALSQVVHDQSAKVGAPINVEVIVLSDELMRVPASPSEISASIYDLQWRESCQQTFANGLYPGHFIGQLHCKDQSQSSPHNLEFIMVYQGRTAMTNERLSVKIDSLPAVTASASFYAIDGKSFEFSDSQKSIQLSFSLTDKFGNTIKSPQLAQLGAYAGSTLLDATYKVVNEESGQEKTGELPLIDEDGLLELRLFTGYTVGWHTLELQLASVEKPTIRFELKSAATELSPLYSTAELIREQNSSFEIGSLISVAFTPRNKHNSTLVSLEAIGQQVYCYVVNDQNSYIELEKISQLNETTFVFETLTTIQQAGNYSAHLQIFNEAVDSFADSYTLVKNGLFEVMQAPESVLGQVSVFIQAGFEWLELTKDKHNFYSESIHGPAFVFKVEQPIGFSRAVSVEEIEFLDFSTMSEAWTVSDFTKIDDLTYAFTFPPETYGKQIFTLTLTLSLEETEERLEWQILTTDRLDQNPSESQANSKMIECPQILTMTAGSILTFECFVNDVSKSDLIVTSESLTTYSTKVTEVSDTVIQVQLAKTLASTGDILYLTDQQTSSSAITIDVVPAALQSLTVKPVEWQHVTSPHEVDKPFLVQITMLDQYLNMIPPRTTPYSEVSIADLFDVSHENAEAYPVEVQIELREQDFLVNITSQFEGTVTISSPLFGATRQDYQIQFYSMLLPSVETSFAIVQEQKLVAGSDLVIKVYPRDIFGNKDLQVLKYYDPETSKVFKISVTEVNPGASPIVVTSLQPETEDDGSIVLVATINLTKATFYRIRTQMFNIGDFVCSGNIIQVLPAIGDSFSSVIVQDFTMTFSKTEIRLLQADENPRLTLQFLDMYDNILDQPAFVDSVTVSIVDLYNEKEIIYAVEAPLEPVEARTDLFTIDLCQTTVGLESQCLSEITYGRLKVEDTSAGTGKVLFAIDMIQGRLEGTSLQTLKEDDQSLTDDQMVILNQMVTDSVIEGIEDWESLHTDSLQVTQSEQTPNSFEIKTVSAKEDDQIVVVLEEFDPLELQTIDLGIIEMKQESATEYVASITLSKSGIYFFKAFKQSTGVEVPCTSVNCIAVITDAQSGLIEPGTLQEGSLRQGEVSTVLFDFEVVPDEQLTVQAKGSPANFSFETETITVVGTQSVYVTVKVTQAMSNTLVELELLSNLFPVASKTLLVRSTSPETVHVTYSANQQRLEITATDYQGVSVHLSAQQASTFLQIVRSDDEKEISKNMIYEATQEGKSKVLIPVTAGPQPITFQVYTNRKWQTPDLITVPAASAQKETSLKIIDKDGNTYDGIENLKSGLYQITESVVSWLVVEINDESAKTTQIAYVLNSGETGVIDDQLAIQKTAPFLLKLYRLDSEGNRLQEADGTSFQVTLGGINLFELTELPNGSAIGSISAKRTYNDLQPSTYELKVTTLIVETEEITQTETYKLAIYIDSDDQEFSSEVESLEYVLSSISVETLLGHSFTSILRKGIKNQIVFKTLDQFGQQHDFQEVIVELATIQDEFSSRVLTQMANDGAYILTLVPQTVRQTQPEQLQVVFTTGSNQLEVTLDYTIQYEASQLEVVNLIKSPDSVASYEPSSRVELSFQLIGSDERALIVNDTQVHKMLQVQKDGNLFAGSASALRQLVLSETDFTTFSLSAFLGDSASQVFDLYFIDETDLWHQLFSIKYNVAQQEALNLRPILKSNKNKKQLREIPQNVSVQIISNLPTNELQLGLNYQFTVIVVNTDTKECLSPTVDFNYLTDLTVTLKSKESGQLIDRPSKQIVKNTDQQNCQKMVATNIKVTKDKLIGTAIELLASLQNEQSADVKEFTVKNSKIDFRAAKVSHIDDSKQSDSVLINLVANQVFQYRISFFDYTGRSTSLSQGTQASIIFDESIDQSTVKQQITEDGLVTLSFSQPGTYFVKGYSIGMQDIHLDTTQGPTIFQVTQEACPTLSIEPQDAVISSGQTVTFSLKCLDAEGLLLSKQPTPAQVRVALTRTQYYLTTTAIAYEDPPVRATVVQGSNGSLQVSQTLPSLGQYAVTVLVNDKIVSEALATVTVTADQLCVSNAINGSDQIYLCPETSVCTSNYFNCPRYNPTVCTDSSVGLFQCFDDNVDLCVQNVMTDCCPETAEGDPQFYCPYLQTCVASEDDCCQLNPDTPIYCEETSTCVSHEFECCSNYLSATNPMTKCTFEDKCVPANTDSFCFIPLQRSCDDLRFPYLCPNDGVCRRSATECPTPQVCPPGYTQCPDRTCVPGLAKYSDCRESSSSSFLTNCLQTLPYTSDPVQVGFIRCSDGRTCVNDVDDCPTEISCLEEGYIVCPDSSCRKNAFECVQPPEEPFDIIDRTSCGPQMIRCPNGQCSDQCNYIDEVTVPDCAQSGQVLCGRTLTCADTYQDCSVEVYCPITQSYTLSPTSYLCGNGPQICMTDLTMCQSTACSSQYAFWNTNTTSIWPYSGFDPEALHTCPDGRCIMNGACMTPFQCSSTYIKAGGFGLFCVQTEADAQFAHQTAIKLHALSCPQGSIMCLNGECRSSVYDCPQDTTCNLSLPVQCKDAQCATTRATCERVDDQVNTNLRNCLDQNLLLCSSDLITCTESQDLCPTLSTCPFGYIKCSETLCINPLEEECPGSFTTCSDIVTDTGLYCRSTQQCVGSYETCPTITSCPQERPVKCASDQSCRESIALCPTTFSTASSTSNQASVQNNLVVCPSNRPVKCEDGSCRSSLKACSNTISESVKTCLKSKENYFCFLSGTCVSSKDECQTLAISTSPCPSGSSYNLESKNCEITFSLGNDETTCSLTNQFYCSESGKCQDAPCDEWVTCPDGQYLCSTGQCVTDSSTCPSSSNWCPFYKPVRCTWTAECVSSLSDCSGTEENLQTYCQETYTGVAEVACSFEGNCKATSAECATSLPSACYNFLFPNTIKDSTTGMSSSTCYVPSCPASYPIKCQNGLCVADLTYCPSVQGQISDFSRCNSLSASTGKSLTVPCADGSCVQSPNQCLPIYSCDLNTVATVRCSDGTCRETESDCPQLLQASCPTENLFRCDNGMCATDSDSCLTVNGCPQSLPYRCEYNGICMTDDSTCYSPFDLMGELSLLPTSSTQNLCEVQGKIACYSSSTLLYCADMATDCVLTSNQCPATAPIYCDSECKQLAIDCTPMTPQLSLMSLPLADFDKNNVNCPQSTPFRCSDLDQNACKALPYTSYASLANQACSTASQSLSNSVDSFPLNSCVNAMTPYSCGDGTCVASYEQCSTCTFFCQSFNKCVASQADCTTLESGQYQELLQICPDSAPYRCITNGQCVQSAFQCNLVRTETWSQIYEQTFTGQLIDNTCPFSSPIRCITGECVPSYTQCMSLVDKTSTVFQSPIPWGFAYSSDVTTPCQVVCSDGSCRDRQENCPQILGCTDPLKPFKCKVGFCAQSLDDCIELYGYQEEAESAGVPSASCQTEYGITSQKFFRCEDGTCRPAIETSSGYESTCLSYMGCGLEQPFQCPGGMCVANLEDCFNFNNELCLSNSTLPFQCKNFQCVASPQDCSRNPALVTPLTLEYDVNLFDNVTIDFAFEENYSVGRLVLPANPVTASKPSLSGKYRLRFDPVPTSQLNQIKNMIPIEFYAQLSPLFSMNSQTGQISNAQSLITPQVNIYAIDTEITFAEGTRLEFYVNKTSFSQSEMNVTNDFCLARASSANQWECMQREYDQLNDGFWSFNITESGIYAMIVSPNEVIPVPEPPGPDPDPVDPDDPNKDDSSFIFSLVGIMIFGGGLLLLILLVLFILWFFGCLCCCKRAKFRNDPLRNTLAPAEINYDTTDYQAQERERLLQQQESAGVLDFPPVNESKSYLRASQVAIEKENAVSEVREKFEAMIKVKSEEIDRLKDQLANVREEHQRRQQQIDEYAMSERSRKSDLNLYKSQLRDKYRAEVVKITKQAKQEIEQVTQNLKSSSQVRPYASQPAVRQSDKIETDHFSNVKKRYAINDEVQMGSDDSFDSDQQREIALLDQQWNDLVNEYVGDPDLMISPPNIEDRIVLQKKHFKTMSPGEIDISENLMSPSERGGKKNPNSLYGSAMTIKGGLFANRKPPNSAIGGSQHGSDDRFGEIRQKTGRSTLNTESKVNRRGNINISSHYDDNQSQNTSRGSQSRYVPIVTQSEDRETEGYQTAGTYRRRKRGRRDNTTQLTEEEKAASSRHMTQQEDADSPHPPHRLQIRNELIDLARGFVDRWDEFENREFISTQYGFHFVARQTEYLEQTLTVTKAFIPAINLGHYQAYVEKYTELTPQIDEKISVVECADYEGCKCVIQHIKMPMFLTNRSIPVLMYFKPSRDGTMIEQVASSRGSEEVVQAQASVIKKNVVGNSIINYIRLEQKPGGCDWVSVLCIDICGDIPNALKRQGAELQLQSQEKLIYMIKHGVAPKK